MMPPIETGNAVGNIDVQRKNQEKASDLCPPDMSDDIDPGPAHKNKPLSFHMAFLSLLLMVFLVSLDATTLAVAIPAITSQLQGTSLEAFWASISFTLAVVITQPVYISVSDVLGRMFPLYAACFLFTIGSVVFAVAQSMPVVILGRVLQGLGGGGLDVLTEVILADITTLKERPLYIGFLSVPMAAGTILGPVIGALFSEYVDWRWIGWVNLPLIGLAVGLAFFFLRLKALGDSFKSRLARMDWIGLALFSIGSVAFSLPLSWAGAMYPWSSWRTILPLIIGVLVLIIFGIYERRPAQPVFPYRIFRSRTALVTLIGAFLHGAILYTLLLYLPLFFQAVFLESPLRSGISMIPFCCILMVFSGVSVGAVEYVRKYNWGIWIGWVLLAVGVGLFAIWDRGSSRAEITGFQAISVIGLGGLFTILTIPIQASAPKAEDQGLAVGILVSFRLFGALIALAIGATTFSSVFANSIASIGKLEGPIAVIKNPNEAVGFIPHLRSTNVAPEVLLVVQEAYKKAMQAIWYILTAFGGVGLLASLWTEELSLETEELGRQHFEQST